MLNTSMLNDSALYASVVVALVGVLIIWSNPARRVNRLVFSTSLHICVWLLFLHFALSSRSDKGLQWLRLSCAFGASVPIHFWVMREGMANASADWLKDLLRRCAGWVFVTIVLTWVPFTDYFIPSHSTSTQRIRGWGYHGYMAVDLAMYIFLLLTTFRETKRLTGGRRLELQIWLLGGCIATSLILATMALNSYTHERIYVLLQPVILLVFYAGTILAITTNRIFDARQILLVAVEKILLVTVVAFVAFVADWGFAQFLPQPLDWIPTIAVALWLTSWLNSRLDTVFQFYPQANMARQAAFSAAQRETRVKMMETAFRGILRGWGQTEHAIIVSGSRAMISGDGIELEGTDSVVETLKQLRWTTPERLARERATPQRQALAKFLAEQDLGVLVIAEGPSFVTLIGVGVPASRRPYTYPQVTQLMELASIMESALERAYFAAKVQHTEQLATVGLLGASLAHEIRNPLVTIKTFVQLLPRHYEDGAFRDKFFKLIGDEVNRIDQLTEQLLDLASPRTYQPTMIELHAILHASLDLVSAKAAHKNVQFLTEFSATPDHAFTDASAAKQVMLNLCFNAIQAVEGHEGERWVKVGTRNTNVGIEMAVADSGPGISPEIRPRLFQPFQTTKSTGFGLGLAICSDILANLNASISVDPPHPGHGATFRVIFPCQPSSS